MSFDGRRAICNRTRMVRSFFPHWTVRNLVFASASSPRSRATRLGLVATAMGWFAALPEHVAAASCILDERTGCPNDQGADSNCWRKDSPAPVVVPHGTLDCGDYWCSRAPLCEVRIQAESAGDSEKVTTNTKNCGDCSVAVFSWSPVEKVCPLDSGQACEIAAQVCATAFAYNGQGARPENPEDKFRKMRRSTNRCSIEGNQRWRQTIRLDLKQKVTTVALAPRPLIVRPDERTAEFAVNSGPSSNPARLVARVSRSCGASIASTEANDGVKVVVGLDAAPGSGPDAIAPQPLCDRDECIDQCKWTHHKCDREYPCPPPVRGQVQRGVGVGLLSAAVPALAAGTVFVVLANSRSNSAIQKCGGNLGACPADRYAEANGLSGAAHTYQAAATWTFIGGGAVALTGAALLLEPLVFPRAAPPPTGRETCTVNVLPLVGPGATGVSLRTGW